MLKLLVVKKHNNLPKIRASFRVDSICISHTFFSLFIWNNACYTTSRDPTYFRRFFVSPEISGRLAGVITGDPEKGIRKNNNMAYTVLTAYSTISMHLCTLL